MKHKKSEIFCIGLLIVLFLGSPISTKNALKHDTSFTTNQSNKESEKNHKSSTNPSVMPRDFIYFPN